MNCGVQICECASDKTEILVAHCGLFTDFYTVFFELRPSIPPFKSEVHICKFSANIVFVIIFRDKVFPN